ncbi:Tripeptidyl-peptidase II [Bertholletia excelsa]
MKGLSIYFFLCFALLFPCLLGEAKTGCVQNGDVFIVYMGAPASRNGTLRYDHAQLLTSLSKVLAEKYMHIRLSCTKRNAVVHTYSHGFTGFAARLSEEEASSIAKRPGVVSVFPDPVLKVQTTRSWDFLDDEADLLTIARLAYGSGSSSSSQGSDTIIGIMDTGIWPESASFSDEGMGPVPSRWKGTCVAGQDFSSSLCNRKLIGARYYDAPNAVGTARDTDGHGTHVASTMAGVPVGGASYNGLAAGTAKGGSPGSRIAVYRACGPGGCYGSSILAAFDNAIADGVDVLSLSIALGSAGSGPDFETDIIAIGAFHAFEKGITVVCSAGNQGPEWGSIVNVAPWILTVGATTIDRDFETTVLPGNNKALKGRGIHFGDLKKNPVYPLIRGINAKKTDPLDDEASNCNPDALDEAKVKGKIVVCEIDDDEYTDDEKAQEVQNQGGIGAILVDNQPTFKASTYGSFPVSVIPTSNASDLLKYLNSTSNPVGTIIPTVTVKNFKPAPVVASFSSRGPSYATNRLLKPDVVAPGVNILAAWLGNDTSKAPKGKKPPQFYLLSGTSMSCAHVSGIAAAVKSQFPNLTPSAIKSAIMTTASQTNNLKASITDDVYGTLATPFDSGSGEVTLLGSLQPGLVYETSTVDYLIFLCNLGYNISTIKTISSNIPAGFSCPQDTSEDLISNMNYPSISIGNFDGKESRNVTRTVTNVGDEDETTYTATMDVPDGLEVKVVPEKLQFTKSSKKLSYQVIFSPAASSSSAFYMFGSITWTNGKYEVRTPFVVTVL